MIGLIGYIALIIAACIALAAYIVWIMRVANRNDFAEKITAALAITLLGFLKIIVGFLLPVLVGVWILWRLA